MRPASLSQYYTTRCETRPILRNVLEQTERPIVAVEQYSKTIGLLIAAACLVVVGCKDFPLPESAPL
jgi:hypothetical protein